MPLESAVDPDGVLLLTMGGPGARASPSRHRQRSHSISFPTSSSSSQSSFIDSYPLRKRQKSASDADQFYSPVSIRNIVAEARTSLPRARRRNLQRGRRTSYKTKMPFLEAHYYPLLFALMTLSAMAELGLTAFLISAGNENGTWPTPRYHSLLLLFCFNAAWTTLFSTTYMLFYVDGASHFLANIASSVIWLLLTSVLWGAAAGIMHNTRSGGDCAGRATISRCRQSLTVEALGWTEFGLCALTLAATCLWIYSSRRRRWIDSKLGASTERFV